jgi:mycothiol synthase
MRDDKPEFDHRVALQLTTEEDIEMESPANAGLVVVHARTDAQLDQLAAVRRTVDPDANPSLESLRHRLEAFADAAFLLALIDGEPLGCGYAAPSPGDAGSQFLGADMSVVPAARRRGIGAALYRAASDHARSLARSGLTVEAKEDDADSLGWLDRRGFVEIERQKALVLDLAHATPDRPRPPAGVRIVAEEGNAELEPGMYRVGLEAGRDIPGLDGALEPTFDEWRAAEVDRPSRRKDLSFVALAGEDVIGYASLHVFGDPKTAFHSLTAVSRGWRSRGVGTALKRAQIVAASRAGIARLMTESEERNAPMRRINEKLGYEPMPGMVVLQGPLAAAL